MSTQLCLMDKWDQPIMPWNDYNLLGDFILVLSCSLSIQVYFTVASFHYTHIKCSILFETCFVASVCIVIRSVLWSQIFILNFMCSCVCAVCNVYGNNCLVRYVQLEEFSVGVRLSRMSISDDEGWYSSIFAYLQLIFHITDTEGN